MSNCEQHKKEVAGISDMKVLAEMVGDLHYESLHQFFNHLSNKVWVDGLKDDVEGRKKLGKELINVHHALRVAAYGSERAWEISKHFMKK